ncbi:MAG: PAS domain S-box protein [Gammaproteobacteria bacterium]|nr:PAS domain S-box protein [Gammaproteobacteria bacterium]
MPTTVEHLKVSSIGAETPDFKPRGFTLRRKIIVGFSGLMLLMTICIVITLYELTTIEKSAISVIEHQQPTTILILSLSEDLNLAISLLNELLLSGNENDIAKYQLIYQRLYVYLDKIEKTAKQSNRSISVESIKKLRSLLDEIGKHGSTLIFLVGNLIENYPGFKVASEQLNPPALEFIGTVNDIIDGNDIDAPLETVSKIRELLYKVRYTWTQMLNSVRLYFSQRTNEFNRNSDDLNNFRNYSELNEDTLIILQEMDVDIGFDAIESLIEIRTQFLQNMRKIVDIRHRGQWRADVTLMRTKVNPLVKEMRSLLAGLVDEQVKATNASGNALTSSLEQIRTYTTALLLFALGSGLLLSIMITKSILPPIRKLMEAARQVTTGDLDAEVHLKTKDEIGLLGGSFNTMVEGLRTAELEKQQYTKTLETLNAELEARVASRTADLGRSEARIRTIYDNIGEGIIVIDEKGYIDSINPAAQRIFSVDTRDVQNMHAIFFLADKKYKDLTSSINYDDEKDGPFKIRNSKDPIELEGKRIDGSTFPMEMVVTSMTLGANHMRACIVRDITARKHAEERLAEAQNNIVDAAHKSGMAEMATGVLHNIGNILNSVNVSVEEVSRIARNSKIQGLKKANAMLSDNLENISDFFSHDNKGKKLPEYFIKIGGVIEDELDQIIEESKSLGEKTTMMKEVISTQQAYATAGFFTEKFQVAPLVEDALKVQKASLHKWGVDVIKNFSEIPDVAAQKSKLLQVITNLIKNAKEATDENDELNKHKEIVIEIGSHDMNTVYVSVYDNGCGINEENLSSVFNHGFTTKPTGHGFGLHTSANSMTEMGGSLAVNSNGPHQGTCFTVSIPIVDATQQRTDNKNHIEKLKIVSEK